MGIIRHICAFLCLGTLASITGVVNSDKNDTFCDQITIKATFWHKVLEGVYELMPIPGYECSGRNVYLKRDVFGDHFLYFINRTSWKGWMVGSMYCVNKGFLSVSALDKYPEQINITWEEFDGWQWQDNEQLIFGCSSEIIYYPPKFKTTTTPLPPHANKTSTRAPPPPPPPQQNPTTQREGIRDGRTTTTVSSATPQVQASTFDGTPGHIIILLYVVVPVGCFAVIILAVVVILLYFKKQPVLDPTKLKARPEPAIRYVSRSGHSHLDEEAMSVGGSVYNDDASVSGHSRLDGDGSYDYQELCTSGSTGSLRIPGGYAGFGDKYGSWRSAKSMNSFKA